VTEQKPTTSEVVSRPVLRPANPRCGTCGHHLSVHAGTNRCMAFRALKYGVRLCECSGYTVRVEDIAEGGD
jgi:hypothetical protein